MMRLPERGSTKVISKIVCPEILVEKLKVVKCTVGKKKRVERIMWETAVKTQAVIRSSGKRHMLKKWPNPKSKKTQRLGERQAQTCGSRQNVRKEKTRGKHCNILRQNHIAPHDKALIYPPVIGFVNHRFWWGVAWHDQTGCVMVWPNWAWHDQNGRSMTKLAQNRFGKKDISQ